MGFNRTFMELKYKSLFPAISLSVCFNRTFMELKFSVGATETTGATVLIVPLWN